GGLSGDGDFAAVSAVPGRNAVTPPQLAGNAPIPHVLDPVEINLLKPLGDEADPFSALGVGDRLLRQRLHLHKPLGGEDRFHHGAGTLAVPDRMHMILDLDQKSTRLNSSHVKISYAVFCLKKK